MKPCFFALGLLLLSLPPADPAVPDERLAAEGLDIHGCGEYAAWKRLKQKDFLDFVDVAASGSA